MTVALCRDALFLVEDERVRVLSERGTEALTGTCLGDLHRHLAPHLDGRHTVEELSAAAGESAAESVRAYLHGLETVGGLEGSRSTPAPRGAAEAALARLTPETPRVRGRLGDGTVDVRLDGLPAHGEATFGLGFGTTDTIAAEMPALLADLRRPRAASAPAWTVWVEVEPAAVPGPPLAAWLVRTGIAAGAPTGGLRLLHLGADGELTTTASVEPGDEPERQWVRGLGAVTRDDSDQIPLVTARLRSRFLPVERKASGPDFEPLRDRLEDLAVAVLRGEGPHAHGGSR